VVDGGYSLAEENEEIVSTVTTPNLLEMLSKTKAKAVGGGGGGGGTRGQKQKQKQKRFAASSQVDPSLLNFFGNKLVGFTGDPVDPEELGLGFTCRKGLKQESPNQDSWMVLSVAKAFSLYGVFDGHGPGGHEVSHFVKEELPKAIIADSRFRTSSMPAMLRDSFHSMQRLVAAADKSHLLEAQSSGTTCTICVHDHSQKKITIAHVADSTCVLGQYEDPVKRDKLVGYALTRDHKPNLKDEKARIEKAGGRVIHDGFSNHRVYAASGSYPGLNMSRCLGDLVAHSCAGCTCEPEVVERKLKPEDQLLLLCSDGVWEYVTPQEAVDLVGLGGPGEAMASADRLAKLAWDRWLIEEGGLVVDDITALVVYLQHQQQHQPHQAGRPLRK